MSYAIVSIGGKQYRVREGEQVLVDRIALDDGATFTPPVLLVGGDGETTIAPDGVTVTARVVEHQRGPKIRIGKYRKRTGYRRHTGFRSALTRVQIESIGAPAPKRARAAARDEAPHDETAPEAAPTVAEPARTALPEGYAEMTVADIKGAVGSWDLAAIQEAHEYEQEHGKRKGALAALESALADKEGG